MKIKMILLALLVMVAILPASIALDEEQSSVAKIGVAGKPLMFTEQDFKVSANPDKQLKGILITQLPSFGQIGYEGRILIEGEAVPAEKLDTFCFLPTGSKQIETSFKYLNIYQTDDITETESTPYVVNVLLEKKENKAPIAQDIEFKTYKNIPITAMFKATDPDGDSLTYRVTSKGKRGNIKIADDGSFTYEPFNNKTGADTITFVAVDNYGNTSPEAKIKVKIENPNTKETYSDMKDNPAYYSAVRLLEHDVFQGKQINGEYYFEPELEVTRGEFIKMLLTSVDMDKNITPTAITGFADDEDIPTWVKPYAQVALKKGIVSGVETEDGRKFLYANRPITMAEAVCLVNKAVMFTDVSTVSDDAAVPVWASQSASNLNAIGVIADVSSWTNSLTRADAAQLLCKTIDFHSANADTGGLLSWVMD